MMKARRAEVALARATATLLSVHAHLIEGITISLAGRLPPDRVVELYCSAQDVAQLDEAWLRVHALAHLGCGRMTTDDTAVDSDPARRLWASLRHEVRIRTAPQWDAALREELRYEFAHARAVLIKVHARNAIRFADDLSPTTPYAAAVAQYIRRMDIADDISGAVYAFAMDRKIRTEGTGLLPLARAGNAIQNQT